MKKHEFLSMAGTIDGRKDGGDDEEDNPPIVDVPPGDDKP